MLLAAIAFTLPPGARANGWEHGAIPFDALLRALAFEQPETRRRAAESLGHRGQREAVPPLLARLALPEPDPYVRASIVLALGRLGDSRASAALLRCLEVESREELRGDCTVALGMLGDAAAVPRLLRALREEPSFLVKSRVVDALGSFAEPSAVAALATLLAADGHPQLRLRAIRALGRTGANAAGPPLLAALARGRTDAERVVLVEALTGLRLREAVAPLTALLETTGHAGLRARIAIALGAIRDGDALPTLVRLLGDRVPAVRFFAVESLRALGRPVAAAPLAALSLDISRALRKRSVPELLADVDRVLGDLSLQEVAVRALTELNAPGSADALLAAAESRTISPDSTEALRLADGLFEVRRAALVGLGYTRSRQASTLLVGPHGLGDADFRLRASAVRSLGVLGFPDAARSIRVALDDPVAEVRWTAAGVLGRLGQPGSAEPLRRRLGDREAEVRRQAALSLGYLGDRRSAGALDALARKDESDVVREAAAYAMKLIAEGRAPDTPGLEPR
jgi:HEAT repeat protein